MLHYKLYVAITKATVRRGSGTSKYGGREGETMTADSDTGEYDPTSPEPPEREPPHRSTAPQSEYTPRQVGFGLLVLVVALAVLLGLAVGLA
jgi:hypothetical protein